MLKKLRRLLQQFFRKSSTLNHQSLNGFSIVVLVLVDIFILVNVFFGLNDISNWYLSPDQTYPCYSEWRNYRTSDAAGKDYDTVSQWLRPLTQAASRDAAVTMQARYRQSETGRLGQVSPACFDFAGAVDTANTPANQQTVKTIEDKLQNISQLENRNRDIRRQYDSTLLEKVAGQSRQQSINQVGAEEAKQKLDANTRSINQLKQEITGLKQELLSQPEVTTLLTKLQNQAAFAPIESSYNRAQFWYPSIQLFFQSLFLVPLILLSYAVHRFALRKNYGLVALLSWHLLIISLIPALIKLFEFLQIGALFQWVFDTIYAIFGGLLFLVSYVQIALIPFAGFLLIKLIQRVAKSGGNPRLQAANRIMQSRCLRCAKKVRSTDAHCPHCGYQQYDECPSCHAMTHRHMPHCTHCGAETEFAPQLHD